MLQKVLYKKYLQSQEGIQNYLYNLFTGKGLLCKMLKAFKYELFPTEFQKNAFNQHFGCTRFIYNWGLEQRIKSHAKGTKLTCLDLANKLPELKKQHPWLAEVNSQALQMPLRSLDERCEEKHHSAVQLCHHPA